MRACGLLSLVLAGAISTSLGAVPRFYVPPTLHLGSVNEVYAWDEVPVASFSVQVFRPGSVQPFLTSRSFPGRSPLGLPGSPKAWAWSAAWVPLDALAEPGDVSVKVVGPHGEDWATFPAQIEPRAFPTEEIHLDPAMTQLRAKPAVRKDIEADQIWAVYQRFNPAKPVTGPHFQLPVSAQIEHSAEYGDTREFLYSDGTSARDYHRGTDFKVPVGTPVTAPARGTVVLVANRMLTGKTVVVEHAPGLYSVYFHLSKILVVAGQKVQPGQKLALSGATGLVTGPHLHWEIRCQGISVDPFDLVNRGVLDTDSVIGIISSIENTIH